MCYDLVPPNTGKTMKSIASISWPAILFCLTSIASANQAFPIKSKFESAEIVAIPDSILPRSPRSEALLLSIGCHFKVVDPETINRLQSLVASSKREEGALGERQFDHGLAILFKESDGKEQRYFFERLTVEGQLWGKSYESLGSATTYSFYVPEVRTWVLSRIKKGKFQRLSPANLAECNFN
jgi:hypothetical protein